MFLTIILLLLGLTILVGGAEILVRGSSSISKKAGIPPIVIGLTIVAFGTSAPELIVNIFSAIKGTTDIAIGNIIGSNIANILLILGISAMISGLAIQKNTTWKEIPFATLAMLILFVMVNDKILDNDSANSLTRTDGLTLLGFFAIFMYYTIELVRRNPYKEMDGIKTYSYSISILLTIGGLIFLFLGGQLLVNQAVILARLAGLSEIMIGLTIVAVGTSLPELATSVVAAIRGQSDIAVGNIVGSNIFNILWVLGITSIIRPLPVGSSAEIDILVCLGATIVLFFAMFIGERHRLKRWQGALFVLSYIAYIIYVIQRG
ncbi:MAG: calcium/sodium antiporter [Candidatus Peregrinibacteria bacterium]